MSETINTFSAGPQAPIPQIELAEYANGARHLYSVDSQGKKHHISHDKVLEAWGVEARPATDRPESTPVAQNGNGDTDAESASRQPDFGDLSSEEQVRELANWNMRVHTVPGSDGDKPVEGGPKPSKAGLSVDDLRYDMWLKENAQGPHSGQNVLTKAREEARMQRVREWARLEMRVKTGMATGDEIAYYRTLEDAAEESKRNQAQNDPDAGRLPMSDELLEQAHAENEGFDVYNSGQAHAENEGFDIYNSGQAHQENANFDINKVYDQAHAENERLDNFLREFSPGAHTGLSEALNEALKEYVRVHAGLGEALNEYARISAEQRNGHHGRVEGGRLKAFLHGLSKKRSDAMDAAVNEQRVWYKQRLDGMANLVRELYGIKGKDANFTGSNELFTHAKVLQLRANQLVELEGAIFDHRVEQANESRFTKLNNFLAKSWHNHGKVRRTLVVAALPFAAGAAIGLAASALPAAASMALGAGVVYGGLKLGQEHARRVNKSTVHQLAKEAVVGQAARSAAATVQSELARRPESDINSNIDFTTITEAVTTAEVKQNQGRRSKIGRIAAVAAGLGYGAGKITSNLLSADHNTVPTKQTGTGAGHDGQSGLVSPPAEATPTYGDGFSTNNLPWNVANHYVGPNEAMDTVSRAVDVINQQTGAGYSLHNVAGNVQVYLDGHALNPAAQAHFNDMMVQMLKLQ